MASLNLPGEKANALTAFCRGVCQAQCQHRRSVDGFSIPRLSHQALSSWKPDFDRAFKGCFTVGASIKSSLFMDKTRNSLERYPINSRIFSGLGIEFILLSTDLTRERGQSESSSPRYNGIVESR